MKSISKKARNDILLVLALIILSFIMFFIYKLFFVSDGSFVVVEVDGIEETRFLLSENKEYLIEGIDGSNLLLIKDGNAQITQADCKDKICVNHNRISKSGESIICLPHRVVVRIVGNEESQVDAVAR